MSAYNGLGLPILNPTFGISMPFYLAADVPFSIKVSQVLNQGITLWQSYTLKKHSFNVTISKSRSFVTDYDGVKSSKTWIGKLVLNRAAELATCRLGSNFCLFRSIGVACHQQYLSFWGVVHRQTIDRLFLKTRNFIQVSKLPAF